MGNGEAETCGGNINTLNTSNVLPPQGGLPAWLLQTPNIILRTADTSTV